MRECQHFDWLQVQDSFSLLGTFQDRSQKKTSLLFSQLIFQCHRVLSQRLQQVLISDEFAARVWRPQVESRWIKRGHKSRAVILQCVWTCCWWNTVGVEQIHTGSVETCYKAFCLCVCVDGLPQQCEQRRSDLCGPGRPQHHGLHLCDPRAGVQREADLLLAEQHQEDHPRASAQPRSESEALVLPD